jgi:hypothetical protein
MAGLDDVRVADFRFANALRGSLEVFDLAHPAGQWVLSGENLGHHFARVGELAKAPDSEAGRHRSG